MSSELDILKRRLKREIESRKNAESILEAKALELYESNASLKKLNTQLEEQVKIRTLALQRSEVKYRSIVENMPLGLLEVDNDGIITTVYNNFKKMTGYEESDLVGKHAETTLLAPPYQTIRKELKEKGKAIFGPIYQVQIVKKDGTLIWGLLSGAQFVNEENKVVGAMGIVYDITEQIKLQEALEIAEKEALSAQQAEQQFLAHMSHEIRTPLNAVIGMTHLMNETQLDDRQSKYVKALSRSADILKVLIDDILDISKIESGNIIIHKTAFDLYEECHNMIESYQVKNEFSDVRFELKYNRSAPKYIHTDAKLMHQILNNLIGNAEKFTAEGKVVLHVDITEKSTNTGVLNIKVEDTGCGIPRKDIQYIFGRFKQSQNDSNVKGTGLGLSITKNNVELLEGSITVKSQVGIGSVFDIKIPIQIADAPVDPQSESSHLAYNGARILVVEDTPMNQFYIDSILEGLDLEYDIVDDGYAAIEICKKEVYDLILMDVQMPGIDGLETTKRLRGMSEELSRVPIVAVSAATLKANILAAKNHGINGFLAKPFTPKALQDALSEYLQFSPKPKDSKRVEQSFIDTYYDGNHDHAAKMIQIFLDHVDGYFKEINFAFRNKEYEEVASILHKLKPMAAMVGLDQISKEIENAKSAIDQEYISTAQEKIVHITGQLPDLKNQLKSVLDEITNQTVL